MSTTKSPTWFLVVAIIFLLWNLMGLSAFTFDMMQTPESIAKLSAEMQPFYENNPWWHWFAYGMAVIAGVLGCIGLLMKKRWAWTMFAVSMVGIVVQNFHSFFVHDAMSALGPVKYIMPALVIGIGVIELWLSKKAIRRGWLA